MVYYVIHDLDVIYETNNIVEALHVKARYYNEKGWICDIFTKLPNNIRNKWR